MKRWFLVALAAVTILLSGIAGGGASYLVRDAFPGPRGAHGARGEQGLTGAAGQAARGGAGHDGTPG